MKIQRHKLQPSLGKKHCGLILRLALVLSLLLGLGFQARESVTKFLSGRTTWAAEVVSIEDQLLPALSLCPGFRRERWDDDSDNFSDPVRYDSATLPTYFDHSAEQLETATLEEISAWWDNITYSAQDILAYVKAPDLDANHLSGKGVVTAEDLAKQQLGPAYTFGHLSIVPRSGNAKSVRKKTSIRS